MTDLKSIYERIVSTCKELGRSTNQVAAAAGKPDAIRNMRRNVEAEKEGSMNVDTIIAIAQELGVSPGWLITGEGNSGLKERRDEDPRETTAIEGEFVVVGEDTSPAAKLPPPTMPKGRTLKEHLAEQRAASVSVERAIAVTEGAMLAANIKPERVAALRSMIQGCLEEPLDQTIPEAEFAARRAMAKIVLSQFLEQGAAQEDKE